MKDRFGFLLAYLGSEIAWPRKKRSSFVQHAGSESVLSPCIYVHM